jgi:hypothetical protein
LHCRGTDEDQTCYPQVNNSAHRWMNISFLKPQWR